MNILGIHDGHNATAAVLLDGRIGAILSEERLTYRKNEMGFPRLAVDACLAACGLTARDLDLVVFSTRSLPIRYLRIKREFAFTIRDWIDEQEQYWKPLLYEGRINEDYLRRLLAEDRFSEEQPYSFAGVPLELSPEENVRQLARIRNEALLRIYGIPAAKVLVATHHQCHQHYAYFGSPFRAGRTAILTLDGGGDGENGTVSLGEGETITPIAANNCSDLARIYRYITLLLGMKIGEHEYKVMGLAPYASDYEKRRCDKAFRGLFHVPGLLVEYRDRPRDLYFHFQELLRDCRFDGIAGGVQEMVESVGAEWFRAVTTRLGVGRVVFSGGLSMNVKLNKVVAQLESVKEFYSPASGGDDSLAVGACYVAHRLKATTPAEPVADNYRGDRPARGEILRAVAGLAGCTVREGVTPGQVARLLREGFVIGRMAGRMEFGARSLGNRSILADPSDREMVRRINEQIKFRDFWMPFAPSILDSFAERYLVNPKGLRSDHMTMSFDTTPEGRRVLVAAIHPADFTVRPHIVRRELNPDYYALIEEFARLTGVGAVLNTSFNLHGRPIVATPEQAAHVFTNSGLDGMLLEDVLVLRR